MSFQISQDKMPIESTLHSSAASLAYVQAPQLYQEELEKPQKLATQLQAPLSHLKTQLAAPTPP
jgi:hypothetical protein